LEEFRGDLVADEPDGDEPENLHLSLFGFWWGPAPHRTTIDPKTRQVGFPA